MNGVRTHNEIQVPYDHDHDGIAKNIEKKKNEKTSYLQVLIFSRDAYILSCLFVKVPINNKQYIKIPKLPFVFLAETISSWT
jgi:hypothetical protein